METSLMSATQLPPEDYSLQATASATQNSAHNL